MTTDPTAVQLALHAFPAIWLFDLLRYLLPAASLALALRLLPAAWRAARRVQTHTPARGQRAREFGYSMLTVLIFALNGALVFAGGKAGALCLYERIGDRGWGYAALSLLLVVLAHDAWFYWTHRLLHRRGVFRWAHRTHHRSVAPTPWAAYSFAPLEAVVQAAFLPLILLVLPLHPLTIFVFLAHMILRNVLGHAGVELLPRRWLAGAWGRWVTTTLHHDLHHAEGRYNYGLYFTLWDRLCGTEHPQYRARLASFAQAPACEIAPRARLAEARARRSPT